MDDDETLSRGKLLACAIATADLAMRAFVQTQAVTELLIAQHVVTRAEIDEGMRASRLVTKPLQAMVKELREWAAEAEREDDEPLPS
jgi:hypothetical protein